MFRPTLSDSDYIDALDAQGLMLLGIAEARIFGAAIPFCPGWALNELITHLGYIYRLVTVIVGHARLDPPGVRSSPSWRTPTRPTTPARSDGYGPHTPRWCAF